MIARLLVLFALHVRNERAQPRAGVTPHGARDIGRAGRAATRARRRQGAALTFSQMPIAVVAAPVRVARLSLEVRGARHGACQRVGRRDGEGVEPGRGDAFRRGSAGSPRAGAGRARRRARRARTSRSPRRRSAKAAASTSAARSCTTTQVLSEAQLEQIEATLKANEARVASARSRLSDTVITRAVRGSRRPAAGERRQPDQPGDGDHDAGRYQHDQARLHRPGDAPVAVRPGSASRREASRGRARSSRARSASVDSRVDPTTRSVTVRALLPNDRGMLKPGMFLTVKLTRGASNALLVPEQSLVPEQGERLRLRRAGRPCREAPGTHRRAARRRSTDRRGSRGRGAGGHRGHTEAARWRAGNGPAKRPPRAPRTRPTAPAHEAVGALRTAPGLCDRHQPAARHPRAARRLAARRSASCPTSSPRSCRSRRTISVPPPMSSRPRSRR